VAQHLPIDLLGVAFRVLQRVVEQAAKCSLALRTGIHVGLDGGALRGAQLLGEQALEFGSVNTAAHGFSS
jgi:hypothetical protein